MTLEERAEKALLDTLESATYDGPCAFSWVHILDAIRAAVAEEREACIRDIHAEARSWNPGSYALSHLDADFMERRIRVRWTNAQV